MWRTIQVSASVDHNQIDTNRKLTAVAKESAPQKRDSAVAEERKSNGGISTEKQLDSAPMEDGRLHTDMAEGDGKAETEKIRAGETMANGEQRAKEDGNQGEKEERKGNDEVPPKRTRGRGRGRKPKHAKCHECGTQDAAENLLSCKNPTCNLYFCSRCLKKYEVCAI